MDTGMFDNARMYVFDDLGLAWYFDQETKSIRMVDDDSGDPGYSCNDFVSGIQVLINLGYITSPEIKNE